MACKAQMHWRGEIDAIHQKHLNNIQSDSVNGRAFHYTSPVGFHGIIANKSMWFSDCDFLNDISESNYFRELYKCINTRCVSSVKAENFAFRFMLIMSFHSRDQGEDRKFISQEKERRYVCSLSMDGDSLLLWNNYTKTNNMTGYNIEVNVDAFTRSIVTLNNQKKLTGRVVYDKKYQVKFLSDLFNDYLMMYLECQNQNQRNYLYEAMEDNLLVYSAFMKSDVFRYEKEYRVAILERGSTSNETLFREKNGAFLPYINKSFDVKSIMSVTVSPTTRSDFVKKSVESMSDYYGVKNLIVRNSEIPLRY